MTPVTFTASFGDQDKQVEIQRITGGYYHIYVDRYYQGQIIRRDGKWTVLPQDEDSMSMDDKNSILDHLLDGISAHSA